MYKNKRIEACHYDKPLFLCPMLKERTMKLKTNHIELLSDRTTPVNLYLQLRNQFGEVLLLESSDYHSKDNSYSYLCFEALSSFEVKQGVQRISGVQMEAKDDSVAGLEEFLAAHEIDIPADLERHVGLFGYSNFDAVQEFESIDFREREDSGRPDLKYSFYRFQIVINHFKDELLLMEHCPEGEESRIEELKNRVGHRDGRAFEFRLKDERKSPLEDETFREMVRKGKEHCQRGDVFQIVLSRRFIQDFQGDDFQVYRALRSINPSPYLFYFDYGSYHIFGSSPEAQLVVSEDTATIHPIAGTYRRTGDDEADRQAAEQLLEDEKENAEHVMLVDLARNDLSRNTREVKVEKLREVQFFSHVIHLVSEVSGKLHDRSALRVFADSFPAGTLSGAPKYKAMQLIDGYEPHARGFYGGAVGFVGMNGQLNQAIMIRSFFSCNNQLHYQAGAGVVIDSDPEKELQEVNNKLAALEKALVLAQKLEG